MGDLAVVQRQAAQGLAPANPEDSKLRYIHVYDEPDGILSYTQWVKDKNADRDWTSKFFSGRAFVDVRTGNDMKQRLEEELRRLIHRDNEFTDIDSVEKFLDSTVYMLKESPRMLHLPQQSVAAISQANAADSDVLRYLSESVMHQFLGNAYSFDWENMVGVGERIKIATMFEKFPEACRELFGELPEPGEISKLSVKRRSKDEILWRFHAMMSEKDIPALLEVLDGAVAQTYANRALQGEWETFAPAYDGVSYTDRVDNLDGTPQKTWPTNEVHRDWAGSRAVKMGTVMDLIKQGEIKWPGLRPGTEEPAWRHPLSALRRAWSGPTREEKSIEKYYADVAELLRAEYGEALPSLSDKGPKQLPSGP
ncbi:MAG TPA: hypothetical protein VL625_00295 [Patescibacteria group bacterium]|nr:hypothetical protein [Patescibacteria group bacterium]